MLVLDFAFVDFLSFHPHRPGEVPGTPLVYGSGPATANPHFQEKNCPATEEKNMSAVGDGECYFVDSMLSNNWIALRVRNSTHNYVYAESFGAKVRHSPLRLSSFF